MGFGYGVKCLNFEREMEGDMKPKKYTKEQGIDNEMAAYNSACDDWEKHIREAKLEEVIDKYKVNILGIKKKYIDQDDLDKAIREAILEEGE